MRHPVVAGGGWVNVVVDPAGKYLLVSADDSSGQAISKLISVSPDGDLAELAVIDAEGPQMPYFSADSSLLAIGLIDDEVGVWSLAEPASPTRVSTIQTDSLPTATVWSPTGALLAIGTDLGTVTIWDAADPAEPKLVRGFDEAQAAIYAMAFTPDGDRLLGAGGDEVFFVWNLTGQSATAEYVLGSGVGRTTEVRTIHNGASFVGAGNDGSVRVWELELARVRDQICATRGTPLSDVEWSQYIHGLAPFDPCR